MRYEVRCEIPGALITQRATTLERARKLRADLRKKEKVIKRMRLVCITTAAELREERLRLRALLTEAVPWLNTYRNLVEEDGIPIELEDVLHRAEAALAGKPR